MRSLDAQKTQIAAMRICSPALAAGLPQPLVPADRVDDVLHIVRHVHQVEVDLIDLVLTEHRRTQPVDQSAPVGTAEQHDGEGRHLSGLHEGERLEQLVHGAEAAGQHDEGLGVLHEHRLAREEVTEVQADVDVVVEVLLERQLDAEAYRNATGLAASFVDRLHDPGTAAGDDGKTRPREGSTDPLPDGVLRVVPTRASRPEDADRRRQLGEQPEPLDELRLDPQDPPRVGVHPVRRPAGVEESLVGRAALDRLVAAQRDRTALLFPRRPSRFGRDVLLQPGSRLRQAVGINRWRHIYPVRYPRRMRSHSAIRGISTYSSRVCARFGSPGPKFTAGSPIAAKRATSVQPSFATGSPSTAATKSAAAGSDSRGSAPGEESVGTTSYGANTSWTWANASSSSRSGAKR